MFGVRRFSRVSAAASSADLIAWHDRTLEKQFKRRELIGKVTKERYARADDESPADIKRLSTLLLQAQGILNQCKREPEIKANDVYVDLLYITVLNTPPYKEEYILSETSEIFSNNENDFVLKGTEELLGESRCRNPVTIMKLYAKVVKLYADSGRIKEAENLLAQAKRTAEKLIIV